MSDLPLSGLPARAGRPARRALAAAVLAWGVGAAHAVSPAVPATATTPAPPPSWLAPLPAAAGVAAGAAWWSQFDDPLLPALIDAAQAVSPDIASAASRIAQARATRVAAGAALGPQLNASASASRARADLSQPAPATSAQVGLAASWEIDLLGGARAERDAARARLQAAEADAHGVRVAVAAEVVDAYLSLRACEAQVRLDDEEARSRAESARLVALRRSAGLESPLVADQAEAQADSAAAQATERRAQCDRTVKSLVALSAWDEPMLRERLAAGTGRVPAPATLVVGGVPAVALAQRPDLFAAARELEAAAADVDAREADRLPRVSLSGSLSAAALRTQGLRTDGTVWSFGPLQVTLPLFDGGARRANADAARAAYDAARSDYAARLRVAVREVEEALVRLDAADRRREPLQRAAERFERAAVAVQAQADNGLASRLELEDARRNRLASQAALIEHRREQTAAWVALYRALGGGWSSAPAPIAAAPPAAGP